MDLSQSGLHYFSENLTSFIEVANSPSKNISCLLSFSQISQVLASSRIFHNAFSESWLLLQDWDSIGPIEKV